MVSLFCPFHGLSKSNGIPATVDLYFVLSGAGLTSFPSEKRQLSSGIAPGKGVGCESFKDSPHWLSVPGDRRGSRTETWAAPKNDVTSSTVAPLDISGSSDNRKTAPLYASPASQSARPLAPRTLGRAEQNGQRRWPELHPLRWRGYIRRSGSTSS